MGAIDSLESTEVSSGSTRSLTVSITGADRRSPLGEPSSFTRVKVLALLPWLSLSQFPSLWAVVLVAPALLSSQVPLVAPFYTRGAVEVLARLLELRLVLGTLTAVLDFRITKVVEAACCLGVLLLVLFSLGSCEGLGSCLRRSLQGQLLVVPDQSKVPPSSAELIRPSGLNVRPGMEGEAAAAVALQEGMGLRQERFILAPAHTGILTHGYTTLYTGCMATRGRALPVPCRGINH